MKILSLRSENVKRISVVEIKPDGNLVEISGKNGSGKTSCLDAIWWALGGARNIQTDPIHHGQETATIRLDLGDLKVTRKFKRKDGSHTTSLSVENADGSVPKGGAQDILNTLLGGLTFDPLAFARMEPAAQYDTLRKFVSDVDFEKIDGQNRGDYTRRAEVKKRMEQAKAEANAIMVPPEPELVAKARQDDSDIRAKIANAGAHEAQRQEDISKRRKAQEAVDAASGRVDANAAEISRLESVLADARRRRETLVHDESSLKEDLQALPAPKEPIDTASLMTRLQETDAHNRSIEDSQRVYDTAVERRNQVLERKESLNREYSRQLAASEELTLTMKKRTEVKEQAIAQAQMPVPGLGFGEGFVTLDGVPFEQGSDAEQLRASIAIAMALAPKLRVIRVRDGSLLDDDSMKILAEMADQHDCQVWLETCHTTTANAVIMVDGHVAIKEAELETV